MKNPINQYIYRATLGLPTQERIDTAAELRVHLNARVKQLLADGFPKEEAQHLAVQEMGPVEPVNKAFLGHVLTNKLGWFVLFGLFAFFLILRFPLSNGYIQSKPIDTEDLQTILKLSKLPKADWRKFEILAPRGTKIISLHFQGGGVVRDENIGSTFIQITDKFEKERPPSVYPETLLVGRIERKLGTAGCTKIQIIRIVRIDKLNISPHPGEPFCIKFKPTKEISKLDQWPRETIEPLGISSLKNPKLDTWTTLYSISNSIEPSNPEVINSYHSNSENFAILGIRFSTSKVGIVGNSSLPMEREAIGWRFKSH